MELAPNVILLAIVVIVTVSYLFSQVLEYINLKAQRKDIPAEIEAFYEREKYIKSLHYNRDVTIFSFLTSGIGFVTSLIMLLAGGFGWVDSLLRPYVQQETIL